jgi:hypothetical protein
MMQCSLTSSGDRVARIGMGQPSLFVNQCVDKSCATRAGGTDHLRNDPGVRLLVRAITWEVQRWDTANQSLTIKVYGKSKSSQRHRRPYT